MNICITGGSGFIGSKLSEMFADKGHEVLVLDIVPPRKKIKGIYFIKVDLMNDQVPKEVRECDAIIHLAGVNIFGRWTEKYKNLILESRTKTASALIEYLKDSPQKPEVFVSASAVGYYGDGVEDKLDESYPAGEDFLASVCEKWEGVASEAENAGMRWVSVRTAVVLGSRGGMIAKLKPLFKLFLGGKLGSGRQWFSWIHIDDLLRVYEKAITDKRLSGPVNASSPGSLRNSEFTKELATALNRPAVLFVPAFALKLVFGELADSVLMSQRVVPKKLEELDFEFKHSSIDSALADIL